MSKFYKHTPYEVGTPKHTEPTLILNLDSHNEERKHLHVTTDGGTKLLLCFDGKAGCFHLRKFTPLGNIGGKVYNNWQLNGDAVNEAAARW